MPTLNYHSFEEKIFVDANSYFEALLADITSVKKTIELESYIFANDEMGQNVSSALINAAKRGVKVRILVDGAGSPYFATSLAHPLEKAGIQTRIFHPFLWQLWNWSRSVVKWPILLHWIYLLLKGNSRNHRKVCIIDKTIAYIGSINITSDHLQKNNDGMGWRDAAVRFKGVPLNELSDAFENAWASKTIKERIRDTFHRVQKNPCIRLNDTWHRRRVLYRNLLKRLRRADHRIWISNAYFVPDNFLLRRLKAAADYGLDVRILLPKKSDVFMMPWASETFYASLLKSGVRIFEYLPNNLHAKVLFVDDWILLGSSNLNYRGILHDLEADAVISKPASKKILEEQFLKDLENSQEITFDNREKRTWHQRFLGKLLLYLKYWF